MSSCKINRWKQPTGSGCAPANPTTPSTNEFNKRLADMRAERSRQDSMWTTEPVTQPTAQPSAFSTAADGQYAVFQQQRKK